MVIISSDGTERRPLTAEWVCTLRNPSLFLFSIFPRSTRIRLRPTRLPRGFSSIISGVIYHPPSAPDSKMQDYLLNCLTSIESQHPNSGILLVGDLNHLNETTLKSNFNLKQIVHFPTRGKSLFGSYSNQHEGVL